MMAYSLNSAGEDGRMPTSCGPLGVCIGVLVIGLATSLCADEQVPSAPSAAALLQRVVKLADAGKFDEVEPLLDDLEREHPSSDARYAAALYAAERIFAAGDRRRAEVCLKHARADSPHPFQPAFADALPWCQVDPRDLKTPTAALLELADRHPGSSLAPVGLVLRAETLAEAKRVDEAIFTYHALLARFPKSRHAPASMLAVARLHHDLVQDREAVQWLRTLLDEHPEGPHTVAALDLGVSVATALEERELAQTWLEQLVTDHEASAQWPEAACRQAELFTAAVKYDEARAILSRVFQRPDLSSDVRQRAQFVLLQIAVGQGDWKQVEHESQALLAQQPAESWRILAWFWHAESAYRRGQRDVAHLRFMDLSLAVEGRTDDWLGIVPLRLAQIEAQKQDWSAALERAELLARERPDYSRMHEVDYLLGRCHSALAHFSEARLAYGRVIASPTASESETAAMAQWMIGETYFLQQRYDDALAAYDATLAYEYSPWQAAALLQAGKCWEQLDRPGEAAKRYEQLVSTHAESRYVAEAKNRLSIVRRRSSIAAENTSGAKR